MATADKMLRTLVPSDPTTNVFRSMQVANSSKTPYSDATQVMAMIAQNILTFGECELAAAAVAADTPGGSSSAWPTGFPQAQPQQLQLRRASCSQLIGAAARKVRCYQADEIGRVGQGIGLLGYHRLTKL